MVNAAQKARELFASEDSAEACGVGARFGSAFSCKDAVDWLLLSSQGLPGLEKVRMREHAVREWANAMELGLIERAADGKGQAPELGLFQDSAAVFFRFSRNAVLLSSTDSPKQSSIHRSVSMAAISAAAVGP
jgi:hypothetical protein